MTFSNLGRHDLGDAVITQLYSARSLPPIGSLERVRMDADFMISMLPAGVRVDAAVSSTAGALSRKLNYSRRRILEEPHKMPNSMRLFAPSIEMPPPGARTHTVPYERTYGDAGVHRRGQKIGVVGGSELEDQFKLWPIVTSFEEDYFEAQSARFAGQDPKSRDIRTARRVIEELTNQINWYGLESAGLYGVLNYPRSQRMVASVSFDGSASADDLLDQLNSAANYAGEQSGGKMSFNRCVMSPKVRNLVMQKRMGSVNDSKVGGQFLEGQTDISTIEEAWELADTTKIAGGGANIHAILLYNDDPDVISRVQPQGVTMLPAFRHQLSAVTVVGAIVGGVVEGIPGSVLVLLVDVGS